MNISTYRHLREYSYEYTPLHIRSVVPVAGKRERFVLYILVPAYCKGEIYTYLQRLLVRERFLLYIPVPTYCEGEICTYLYHLTVSDRFVHNFSGILWERDWYICYIYTSLRLEGDLYCIYLYQLTVLWGRVLYAFAPASGGREIWTVRTGTSLLWERDCSYLYQLTVRERFAHIGTSCWWERERFVLYILVPAYCEGEIYRYLQRLLVRKDFCCTYLYQLTERERFVQICTNLYRPLIEIEIVHICTSLL